MKDQPPTGEGFQAVVDWFMRNGELFGSAVIRARAVRRWAYGGTTPKPESEWARNRRIERDIRITARNRAAWEGR